jgi:hypothetical protein
VDEVGFWIVTGLIVFFQVMAVIGVLVIVRLAMRKFR